MGIKKILDSFEGFKKWSADIEMIEVTKKQARVEGANDASDKFLKVNTELTQVIAELRRENITMRDDLHKEYEEKSKKDREQYSHTIKKLEDDQDTQCRFCRQGMESERLKFKARQMYFAKSIDGVELQGQRMHQYSGRLIELSDIIVQAAAELSAAKTEISIWKDNIDKLIKDAQKYMSFELQDGQNDLVLIQDKNFGLPTMITDTKSKDKKDGGLI